MASRNVTHLGEEEGKEKDKREENTQPYISKSKVTVRSQEINRQRRNTR
jgi:hypothetical protein